MSMYAHEIGLHSLLGCRKIDEVEGGKKIKLKSLEDKHRYTRRTQALRMGDTVCGVPQETASHPSMVHVVVPYV